MSGISLKNSFRLVFNSKGEKHKATEIAQLRKKEFEEFLNQDTISFEHPSKKFSGKRFLRDTLEVTRSKYLQQSEYHKYGIISMSSMKKYRPANILLCGSTPLDQCLCDHCENVEQLLRTLCAIGLRSIPSNRYGTVNKVVCSERVQQIGVEYSFPRLACINGHCESCGEELLKTVIESNNQDFLQENRRINW